MNVSVDEIIRIAKLAGDAILDVYNSDDFGIESKGGEVPLLTKADKLANKVIITELENISNIPIVSEENKTRNISAKQYWLVDPLDGTKEFVKRNGEFTVNIALINNEEPILGVVYAPFIDVVYAGLKKEGAYKIKEGKKSKIKSEFIGSPIKAVTSRSHKNQETEKFLAQFEKYEEISMGSSLKLCLVAEGAAAIYPRFGPTCLWDTAAADAVVRAAGGSVVDTNGNELKYNPNKDIKNPFFIVTGSNFKY